MCAQHRALMFVSPTNLHCSQTDQAEKQPLGRLFPLRIYTALKRIGIAAGFALGLFPLRIYTALKPQIVQE